MDRSNKWVRPIVLGLSDGIINALILATPAILQGAGSITPDLALRVSLVALLTALFTVFMSEYAHLRVDLSRAEHALNITKAGRLATGNLGRSVSRQAVGSALRAGIASFVGSLTPLLLGAMWPAYPWIAIGVALLGLGVLGAMLARDVHGSPALWATISVVGGAIIAVVGSQLHIAG